MNPTDIIQSGVSLIIPTYRNPQYLDLCLHSALENSILEKTKIIVAVDGYVEESKKIIESYRTFSDSYANKLIILEYEQNYGMAYAINSSVIVSPNDLIFVINDDNVLPLEWDMRLTTLYTIPHCREMLSDKDKLCLTINQVENSNGMFGFEVNDKLGNTWEDFDYDQWLIYENEIENVSAKSELLFDSRGFIFPFAMKKNMFLACGGFDLTYTGPNFVDWDFFIKLQLLKFTGLRTNGMHLYHFGSIVTKHSKETPMFSQRALECAQLYQTKWGIKPFHNSETYSRIPPNCQSLSII